MRPVFERFGDRVLSAVLPKEKASACTWGPWYVLWASGDEVFYRRNDNCAHQQCKIRIGDVTSAATCP